MQLKIILEKKMNIVEQFKNGRQIRKMETAAGGPIKKPIKRQKDGYRYIPDEENGGWDRISDNSMSDVFATMEFTPKKTKTGSSITRKQSAPSKTYYSSYNPDDVVKGFNALTLGGLNNLSPTQWARRYYDLNQLLVSQIPGSKRTMTWSGFVNNWINGNNGLVSEKFAQEHPYWSMGINAVGDAAALGGISNAEKVKDVGKITNDVIRHAPEIRLVARDVARTNTNPYNWRKYRFIGDRRFHRDLDRHGIKGIMEDRKKGTYPLTFAERRNYITGLKKDIQEGVDYAMNEAKTNLKAPLIPGDEIEYVGRYYNIYKPKTFEDISPQKMQFGTRQSTVKRLDKKAPWEANYEAFRNSEGIYFPFRTEANTLKTSSSFQDVGERVATGAHETRHHIQSYFDTPLVEVRDYLPGSYGRYTNRDLPYDFQKKVNSYIDDAGTAGEWEGSLNEMDAELTGWGARYGIPSKYSQMTPVQKAKVYDLFQKRFGGNADYKLQNEVQGILLNDQLSMPEWNLQYERNIDNSKVAEILKGLEELGYRKEGGKL